jgi:hypothetical protein
MNDDTPSVPASGLSESEAQARLKTEGFNELPRPDRRTPLRIVLEVLREPMLALLLGAGLIYLLLGDLKEALILLAFAIMSVLITVIQETRTERVLEALRDLTSPRALVIRDGERRRIAGREAASPCRCANLHPPAFRPAAPVRVATICPLSIPARWWCGAAVFQKSWPPGRTAK